jgi:putative oxidoreductase
MDSTGLGLLILRLVVGLTMAAHGAQKVFGWWSGPGIAGWGAAMERMGFRPARFFAWLSAGAELVGGMLLAAGLLTPFAAAAVVGQSVVIIGHVHGPKGFWNKNSGFEFPLALVAGAVAVGLIGAGAMSIDAAIGLRFDDTLRAVLLVAGALGGLAALAVPRLGRNDGAATTGR